MTRQPKVTFQVDLDGSWVLLQWLGLAETGSAKRNDADPLFEQGIPRSLELFARHDVSATYFVNGLDLLNDRKRRWLEQVAAAGHEIASHGWDHSYFSQLDHAARERQLSKSARVIREVFGQAPKGFRAPGYDFDADGLEQLAAGGYAYDCSALPTSIGPALEWSQRLMTGRRPVAYPWWQQLFGPTSPYRPNAQSLYRDTQSGVNGGSDIYEIPVSVFPWLRLPLSFSYGVLLGERYLRAGLSAALADAGTVNFLFHLIDFAGPVEHPRLRKLPGASMPLERRLGLADKVVRDARERAEVMRTDALWESLAGAKAEAPALLVSAGGMA